MEGKEDALMDKGPLHLYAVARTGEAFAAVVRTYQQPVYSAVLRITGEMAAADDVTQGVFLTLLETRIPGDLKSERAWVHRTAVNAALHWRRGARNRQSREKEAGMDRARAVAPPPDEGLARRELADRVQECLDALQEELRVPVLLKVAQGLTYEEVGEAVGAPVATVADRVRRGLEQIRARLMALGLASAALGLEDVLGAEVPVPPALTQRLADLTALAPGGGVATAGVLPASVKALAAAALLGVLGFGGYALVKTSQGTPSAPVSETSAGSGISVSRLAASGKLEVVSGTHGLSVTVDSDLPRGAIVQVCLRVKTDDVPDGWRPVDSKRDVISMPVQRLTMPLGTLLKPGTYEVEVAFDGSRQLPEVQRQVGNARLSARFPLEVAPD